MKTFIYVPWCEAWFETGGLLSEDTLSVLGGGGGGKGRSTMMATKLYKICSSEFIRILQYEKKLMH